MNLFAPFRGQAKSDNSQCWWRMGEETAEVGRACDFHVRQPQVKKKPRFEETDGRRSKFSTYSMSANEKIAKDLDS